MGLDTQNWRVSKCRGGLYPIDVATYLHAYVEKFHKKGFPVRALRGSGYPS